MFGPFGPIATISAGNDIVHQNQVPARRFGSPSSSAVELARVHGAGAINVVLPVREGR